MHHLDSNLEKNYTTFHVFNYVLRAQVEDLINLGVNPIIKKIVFQLWATYLRKLGIAFGDETAAVDVKLANSRWPRDKKYFELLKLHCCDDPATPVTADDENSSNKGSSTTTMTKMMEHDGSISPKEAVSVDDDEGHDDNEDDDEEKNASNLKKRTNIVILFLIIR